LAHQRIALNLCALLHRAFRAQSRNLFAYPNIAVRVPGATCFQPQPDVVVATVPAAYDVFVEDFRLIAEILSPANTRAEIELKLRRYREGVNNLYVLLIEPRELRVEIHARSRNWQPLVLTNRNDRVEMPEFGLSCTVEDLYRDTAVVAQSK